MESPPVGDSTYITSLQRQTLGTGLFQVLVRRELTISRYRETLAQWESDTLIITSLDIHLSNSSNHVFKNRILLYSTYISINTFMALTKQNKNRKRENVFLFGQRITWSWSFGTKKGISPGRWQLLYAVQERNTKLQCAMWENYCLSQMSQPFCPRISSLGMHDLCAKNGLHGNKGLQSLRSSEQDCGHGRNSQKHQACSTAICKRCSDFKQFVFMCARWCMPMCMCACVWRSEVNVGCPSLVLLLSLRQSPTEPGACWLGETGWLKSCSPGHGLWAQAAVGFSRAWTMAEAAVGFSIQMLETDLRSSSLSNKYVIDRTISSIPRLCLEFLSLCFSFITEKFHLFIFFLSFLKHTELHIGSLGLSEGRILEIQSVWDTAWLAFLKKSRHLLLLLDIPSLSFDGEDHVLICPRTSVFRAGITESCLVVKLETHL